RIHTTEWWPGENDERKPIPQIAFTRKLIRKLIKSETVESIVRELLHFLINVEHRIEYGLKHFLNI
ncbi:hypothetical protein M5D96_009764, partial [Drosophila gunungcola]